MAPLFTVENLVALVTLTALELVLGIDNIVFLALVIARLPAPDRRRARLIGLGLALGARILLLVCISWVMGLTDELFRLRLPAGDEPWFDHAFTGKDLILIVGGLFLVAKATHEIHAKLEHGAADEPHAVAGGRRRFAAIIAQIIAIDLVFSLDSVITAVGMAKDLRVMIAAVVVAVAAMMVFAGTIGAFVERRPTIKVLALAFLILIGVMLTAEGFGQHVSKGYIYFAMSFALVVELINLRVRRRHEPSA